MASTKYAMDDKNDFGPKRQLTPKGKITLGIKRAKKKLKTQKPMSAADVKKAIAKKMTNMKNVAHSKSATRRGRNRVRGKDY